MRRPRPSHILLLAALLLLPSLSTLPLTGAYYRKSDGAVDPLVESYARSLYGTSSLIVHAAADDAFSVAFSRFSLFSAIDPRHAPAEIHLMAWSGTTLRGYDLTTQFNALLQDAGALLLTSDDAVKYAKAYVNLANSELKANKTHVGSADSEGLGLAVASPSATQTLDGWRITATTWAQENGVLANWTIDASVNAFRSGEWIVGAAGVGEAQPNHHAIHLGVGLRVINRYASTGHVLEAYGPGGNKLLLPAESRDQPVTVIASATNFDGTSWQVTYPTSRLPVPQDVLTLADALLQAGLHAYGKQVDRSTATCAGGWNPGPSNWSFESADPDCVLVIRVLDPEALACTACVKPGRDVVILVSPTFLEQLRGPGSNAYKNATKFNVHNVGRVIVAHEHFHNLQYVINEWKFRPAANEWDALYEGQARFIETLIDPETVQDKTSAWYNDANDFQRESHRPFCSQAYRTAPFWGYAYAHDGGLAILRTSLEETSHQANSDCHAGLPAALSAALGSGGGSDFTFADALWNGSFHAFTKDLRWSSPDETEPEPTDWAAHLAAASPPAVLVHGTGTKNYDLGSWGVSYLQLSWLGEMKISCTTTLVGVRITLLQRNPMGVVSRIDGGCEERVFAPVEGAELHLQILSPARGKISVSVGGA